MSARRWLLIWWHLVPNWKQGCVKVPAGTSIGQLLCSVWAVIGCVSQSKGPEGALEVHGASHASHHDMITLLVLDSFISKSWSESVHTDKNHSVRVWNKISLYSTFILLCSLFLSRSVSFLSSPHPSSVSIHRFLSCFTEVGPHTLAICGCALEVLFAQIKVCNEWALAPSGPPCQAWQCALWQDDTWAWKNNTRGPCVSCLFIKIYCYC